MKVMSRHVLMAASVLLATTACFDDPTEPLRNGPARLQLSFSYVELNVGDTVTFNVQVMDDQGTPLLVENASYGSSAPSIAVAAESPNAATRDFPGVTLTKAIVVGVATGTANLTVSASGLQTVLPVTVN